MKFVICEKQKKIDIEKKEPNNVRMARCCAIATKSINDDLNFTTEVPEDFQDNKLPTLDFVLWLVCGIIMRSYFEKTMRTPCVIMKRSAMSEHLCVSILSNELIRRLSNVHQDVVKEDISGVLEQCIVQLKTSGYDRKQI